MAATSPPLQALSAAAARNAAHLAGILKSAHYPPYE